MRRDLKLVSGNFINDDTILRLKDDRIAQESTFSARFHKEWCLNMESIKSCSSSSLERPNDPCMEISLWKDDDHLSTKIPQENGMYHNLNPFFASLSLPLPLRDESQAIFSRFEKGNGIT